MFFKELEQLRRDHPSLADLITQIDARLSQLDSQGLVMPDVFAAFFEADQNQVVAIFDELVACGTLAHINMCKCMKCSTLMPSSEYRTSLATGDELLCPVCGTNFQQSLQFRCYRLSPHAMHNSMKNMMPPKTKAEHVILLIHGILTDAVWQEKVAAELNIIPKTEALPIGYGIVELIMFWCPLLTRRFALKTIERKIRHAISLHPGARISVIAHSFGTYAIFRLLSEKADLRFHRVILCGSIISDRYPWDHVQPRVAEPIINDCSTRDVWPAAAKSLTWGYGASGTFGFKSPGIRDRYHDIDHGGFFSEEFVQKYWVPFIQSGNFVQSLWTSRRPTSPWYVKVLASLPFQWISLVILCWYMRQHILTLLEVVMSLA